MPEFNTYIEYDHRASPTIHKYYKSRAFITNLDIAKKLFLFFKIFSWVELSLSKNVPKDILYKFYERIDYKIIYLTIT